MNIKEKILIVGAGLCGSMLALRMAQRGYQVVVYESRSDLRKSDISAGRSINLALSNRGLKALRMAGIEEKARELCIPMKGRLMHDVASNTFELFNSILPIFLILLSYLYPLSVFLFPLFMVIR